MILIALWRIAIAIETKTKCFASVGSLDGVVIYFEWIFWEFEHVDCLEFTCVGLDFPLFFVVIYLLDGSAGVFIVILIGLPGSCDLCDVVGV